MTIDITRKPPADIFRNRGKFRLLAIAFLSLSVCGILLALYVIFSDTPQGKGLETVAFTLFVGPALVFSYFGEKLQAYKRLTPLEERKLIDMNQKHPEIKAYCALLAKDGRRMTMVEYEACQAWAEDN